MSRVAVIIIGTLVAFVVTVAVVMLLGVYGFGWFQRSTANFRGQTGAIEKTKADANFRLNSYQHFFDLCGSVQAQEDRTRILTPAATAPNASAEAITNLQAVQAERLSLIRQYNADATAKFTLGQFRDNKLPYQLDPSQEHTVCVLG